MVGIITFVNEDNYGAVLQAYAMQTFLNQRGIENEFINIRRKDYSGRRDPFLKAFFIELIFFRKRRSFQKFRKCLSISSDQQYKKEKYEKLIIGSDQVWNPLLTGGALQPVFFAKDFPGDIIGYACSCGSTRVLEGQKELLRKYLKAFRSISVREYSLEQFLRPLVSQEISTVLDPVFLLEDAEWDRLLKDGKRNIKGPYLFVYLLENHENITNVINELSETYHLGVVTLRTRKHYKRELARFPGADPRLFLELLSKAELIVTNSFHGFAFSYIYRKPVVLFGHSQFNDRIDHLLRQMGFEAMQYDTGKYCLIDFRSYKCDMNFQKERKRSAEFLARAVNHFPF